MDIQTLVRELKTQNRSKIVMLVADGLGGLPIEPGGPTELEAAKTPNLDALARRGVQGSMYPDRPRHHARQRARPSRPVRLRPGQAPDRPRGAGGDRRGLQAGAEGRGGPLQFLHARRAGQHHRPPCRPDRQRGKRPAGHQAAAGEGRRAIESVFVEPVKEHRFVVVFRGEGLGGNVADTDPQTTGVPPLAPVAHDQQSQRTAEVAKQFIAQAQKLLAGQPKANGLTMRGFSAAPAIASYEEVYGLKAAAIAVYPMYKGLAQLVGMEVVGTPGTLAEEIDVLEKAWGDYDFFFVHFKYTDSRGEDGNFAEKVRDDRAVRRGRAAHRGLEAGGADRHRRPQHACPAGRPQLASGAGAVGCRQLPARRPDGLRRKHALHGGLGHFPACSSCRWPWPHAERLAKFGA